MSNATSLSASIGVIYNSVLPPAHHEDHILRKENDKIKHTSWKLPINAIAYIRPLNETRSDYTLTQLTLCGEGGVCIQYARKQEVTCLKPCCQT